MDQPETRMRRKRLHITPSCMGVSPINERGMGVSPMSVLSRAGGPSHARATVVRRLNIILGWMMIFIAMTSSGCRWTSNGQNTSGVQLFQQGRFAEALQQFETAKRSDPTNPDVYYNLASTYHKMGVANKDQKLIDQAEALYHQCLDLSANHVECHRGLAVLLVENNRQDKAFTFLKNWANQAPNVSDARLELSRLYQEFGQSKVAEQYLNEALAMDPNNSKAWAARGRMRETAGDLQQAIQNYQQSLAINKQQPEVYQRVAAINVRLASNNPSGVPSTTTANNIGSGNITSQVPVTTPRY